MRINTVSIDNTTIDGTGPYFLIERLFANATGQGVTIDPHSLDPYLRLWNFNHDDEEEIINEIPIVLTVKLKDIFQTIKTTYVMDPDKERLDVRAVKFKEYDTTLTVRNLSITTMIDEWVLLESINIIENVTDPDINITNLKVVAND